MDALNQDLGRLPDPSALVFDLDGTLVDTVRVRIDAWLEAFREAGIPAAEAQVADLIGADGKRVAREAAAAAGRELDDDAVERLDRRAGELFEAANVDPRPLPGAAELLRELAASHLRHAIATSSRADQVRRSVKALALPADPPIVDGSHLRRAKPAPDLLLLSARRLGFPPASCWYVGDARWDMLAARAAGMPGIGVPSGAVSAEVLREAGAAGVVEDLDELRRELERRGLLRAEG